MVLSYFGGFGSPFVSHPQYLKKDFTFASRLCKVLFDRPRLDISRWYCLMTCSLISSAYSLPVIARNSSHALLLTSAASSAPRPSASAMNRTSWSASFFCFGSGGTIWTSAFLASLDRKSVVQR